MDTADQTYDLSLLDLSWDKWNRSPALRAYYRDLYRSLLLHAVGDRQLEVGSGCGFLKQISASVTTSDIAKTRYVDRRLSAYELHQTGETWSSLIALDVLHHLTEPLEFLSSACRALESGGRLILGEPAATLGGRAFYRAFHQEPCAPASIAPPYRFSPDTQGHFANMGLAWALFQRDRPETEAWLADRGMDIRLVQFRDLIAYPLTGGLSKPALVPAPAIRFLLRLESCLPQAVLRNFALRMVIVLEKRRHA